MTLFTTKQADYDRAASLGQWAEASVIGEWRQGYLWNGRFYWLMNGSPVSLDEEEVNELAVRY